VSPAGKLLKRPALLRRTSPGGPEQKKSHGSLEILRRKLVGSISKLVMAPSQGNSEALVSEASQGFQNEGHAHGKHTRETHSAGKSGKQDRGILAPHGTVSLQKEEPTQ